MVATHPDPRATSLNDGLLLVCYLDPATVTPNWPAFAGELPCVR